LKSLKEVRRIIYFQKISSRKIVVSYRKCYKTFTNKKDGIFKLGKIQAEIKTSFGKIIIEGSTASDLLETLKSLPENFISDLESAVSKATMLNINKGFNNLVKLTESGPVLILKDPKIITQYEAIGLILYFSKNKSGKPSQIRQLLEYSGIKTHVSSRLNEMAKRGLVLKSSSDDSEWTLSPRGERWVEEEILSKLKRSFSNIF